MANGFLLKGIVMAVKHLKPTSAGRRWQTISDFSEITCTKPEKSLLEPLPKKAGRNNNGRITTRHQGGGVKRRYRVIDFKRNKDGVPAKVATIEYDPNRSARIALLHYADGEKRYILAPKGLSACVFQFVGAVFFPQGWRPSPTVRAWSFTVRYSRRCASTESSRS